MGIFKICDFDIKLSNKKQRLLDLILNHLSDLKKTIKVVPIVETGTVLDDLYGRIVEIEDPIYAGKLLTYILTYIQTLVDKAKKYGLFTDEHEHYYLLATGAKGEHQKRIDFFDKQVLTGKHGELEIIKLLGEVERNVARLAGLQVLVEEYEEREKIPILKQKFEKLLDVEKKEFLAQIINEKLIRGLPQDILKMMRDVSIQVLGLDVDAIFSAVSKLSPSERVRLITKMLEILSPLEAKEILESLEKLSSADISEILKRTIRKRKKEKEKEEDESSEE